MTEAARRARVRAARLEHHTISRTYMGLGLALASLSAGAGEGAEQGARLSRHERRMQARREKVSAKKE